MNVAQTVLGMFSWRSNDEPSTPSSAQSEPQTPRKDAPSSPRQIEKPVESPAMDCTSSLQQAAEPPETILAELETSLAIFNDDFLTRMLRNELETILSASQIKKVSLRVQDIFYFGLIPYTNQWILNETFAKCAWAYNIDYKAALVNDTEHYLGEMAKKIADLKAKKASLSHMICPKVLARTQAEIEKLTVSINAAEPLTQMEAKVVEWKAQRDTLRLKICSTKIANIRTAIERIDAKVSVISRPLPMMEQFEELLKAKPIIQQKN